MYLIIETNNVARARKGDSMRGPEVREALQQAFPGRGIVEPLATGATRRGVAYPVQPVYVYLSRTRDGRARTSVVDEWGLI